MIRQLVFLLIALTPFLPARASDSDLQRQLKDACNDNTFVLRQPDASKDIEFDSQGNRLGAPKPGYWFENAAFQCSIVSVKHGNVTFEGRRFVLEFDVSQKDFVPKPLDKKVRVTIKAAADSAQVSAVLKKISLTKEETVRDAAPDYWHRFFHLESHDAPGGTIKPPEDQALGRPKLVHSPEPDYPQLAKKEGKEGKSVLWVTIDENGNPTDITIVRPAGHGFDDMGVEVVKKWKFEPGTKEGVPVRMRVNIEVNFRLY